MDVDVFALDFDGVLCDSAGECAVTAWRAGSRIWPEWQRDEPPAECRARFVHLRPVVETGYQMIPLMKLIHEGVDDAAILDGFLPLCDALMSRHRLNKRPLVELFGRTRDEWIAENSGDWLSRHRFYPGATARLREALVSHPVFILTTKQERFTRQLLDAEGVRIPEEGVWGLERNLGKGEMLERLIAEPSLRGGRIHFVEDRLDTLMEVTKNPLLDGVCLYLADWGYNTPVQREQAAQHPRVTVWTIDRFLRV
ncbi:MAG: HAD family hydrolase [Deltaproteobacteria bacterium]|nr:HAD family hydrolase [Deltaproteobacteria bacterium]